MRPRLLDRRVALLRLGAIAHAIAILVGVDSTNYLTTDEPNSAIAIRLVAPGAEDPLVVNGPESAQRRSSERHGESQAPDEHRTV